MGGVGIRSGVSGEDVEMIFRCGPEHYGPLTGLGSLNSLFEPGAGSPLLPCLF